VIEVQIMKFHDAHCHISSKSFQKDFNLDEYLPKWREEGMEFVIGVSTKYTESLNALELSNRFKFIIPGIGIHPWSAKKPLNVEMEEKFNRIFSENQNIVIGEIGLDHHFVKKEERYQYQEQYFKFFLQRAENKGLPVNIHIKGAEMEAAEILSSYNIPPNNILIHWYSGPSKILRVFIERDYFFTINPSILAGSTHKSVLENCSINNILTESDGNVKYTIENEPIIGSPGIIPKVIAKIAEIKNSNIDEITRLLRQNFIKYTNLG